VDRAAYVAIQFAAQFPMAIVLVVGLVLVTTRRRTLGGRAGAFALAGCVVLLGGFFSDVAWIAALPWLIDEYDLDAGDFGLMVSALGLVLTLIHATGLALIIAAVLSDRRPPAPPPFPVLRDGDPPGSHIQAL
jgi:hypothetical protein